MSKTVAISRALAPSPEFQPPLSVPSHLKLTLFQDVHAKYDIEILPLTHLKPFRFSKDEWQRGGRRAIRE